jgi:uncharacterized protein with von Willebrand factor type A (vWA) domain
VPLPPVERPNGPPVLRRQGDGTFLTFALTLRASGVAASPHQVQAAVEAVAALDPLDREQVYWAGRLTLCSQPADLPRYDAAFAAYFGLEQAYGTVRRPRAERTVRPVAAVDADAATADPAAGEEAPPATASAVEVLRHRDVARLEPGEREEVRRLIALLRPAGPTRPGRRPRRAHRGRVHAGWTMRDTLRHGGQTVRLRHGRPVPRPRRVVMLVDVSGSMEPYADSLLRFAHAAVREHPGTEVFTLGTRLTRVTTQLRLRDPDAAMAELSAAVPDWSGGTRLGEQLRAFLVRWGRRGCARGAVVVICSDGWERGDVTLLAEQLAQLRRLAHRVVWVNPHRGQPGFEPRAAGMAAALPYVDVLVAGHSLAAFERLAGALSDRGGLRA